MAVVYNGAFSVTFKNEHIIYENEIRCVVKDNEFNLSYNPSMLDENGNLTIANSSIEFTPYVTTIGLYNDNNELLAVAKFSKPIQISKNTDMTFIVKYDL